MPSFSPATSPWVRRRHSPRPLLRWVSHLPRVAVGHISDHVRCVPTLTHQVWVGGPLKGVPSLVHFGLHHSVLPLHSVVVEAASTFPCAPRVRLPPASTGCCDSRWWVLASHPVLWRLVAHDPVGPGVHQLALIQGAFLPGLKLLFPLAEPARSPPETVRAGSARAATGSPTSYGA